LRDVTLGKLLNQQAGEPLIPFTVVIGKNGVGKSTLFDAFGFVADCLSADVETACNMVFLTSLRLQMMMDRRSKFISTLSNIMKKIETTGIAGTKY
jgi:AAA15 family ATPase/GTPase